MASNNKLKGVIVDYAKTRPIFDGYKAAQKEMRDVLAAKANIDHLLGVTAAPELNKEQER